jgi:predicted DNA-binding transcriptional regulator YafY
VQRSERLVKLLDLLHGHPGMDAEALAQACGASSRTLQRDLDALGASGFQAYFDRGGYHLAAPALVPAITLTVDQALALRLAAQSAAPPGRVGHCSGAFHCRRETGAGVGGAPPVGSGESATGAAGP